MNPQLSNLFTSLERRFTICGLTQGGVGQLQSLPVEEGAGGDSELHADEIDPVDVVVVGQDEEGSHGHHPSCVEVSLGETDPAGGCEILNHPACRISTVGLSASFISCFTHQQRLENFNKAFL